MALKYGATPVKNIMLEGVPSSTIAKDNGSVSLENAIANGLNSVTVSGGTTISIDIPSDYTRIEFLESTGTQYIDTGITANFAQNKIEQTATVQYTTSNTSRELMGTNGYGFWGKNASNKIEAALGGSGTTENALAKNTILWRTDPNGNKLLLNVNNNQYTGTASSLVDADYAYYVFALGIRVGSGASASFLCHAKVWDYTIAVDDEVVCHLIPVRRNSDNVLGMYDIVTGTFKTNAGTGTFTAGSDVVTPSPTNPVDIITNNGNITVSPNLFRTLGTTTTQGGVTFTPQEDGSVICTGRATGYYSYYLGRADFDPGTIDKITVAINGTYNASGNIVVDKFHVYSGSTSLGTISYTNWTQYLTVDIANDYPTADNIRVYLKRNSNTDTNATIKPMAVKGTTNKAWKPYGEITTTGTVETVTDEEGNTATAEMLLAMNTYADTQELITGAVNRQLAILVLTGTEAWGGSSSTGYFSLAKTNISPSPISTGVHCYCTHFASDSSAYTDTAGKFWLGGSYLNINYDNQGGTSSSANMTAFKNWLKMQYANGTPVMVVYPIATPTTETVTGQTLTTIDGDNTLTITQASIKNLPIEAEYMAASSEVNYLVKDTTLVWASSKLYLEGPGTYTVVGSPTITNGVLTGFDASNYLKFDSITFAPGSGPFEFQLDYTTGTSATDYGYSMCLPGMNINQPGGVGKFRVNFRTTSENFYLETSRAANTNYVLKVTYDGNGTYSLYSNGVLAASKISTELDTTADNWDYTIGIRENSTTASINLNNTYVKAGNSVLFGRMHATQDIAPVYSGLTFGNITTTNTGVIDMPSQTFVADSTATWGKE